MKSTLFIFSLLFSAAIHAQRINPQSISLGYYGETALHPGFKLGASYTIFNWEKNKNSEKKTTLKHKELQVIPYVGFFYHRNYQTALFFVPEVTYFRKRENGNHLSFGIGAGYMRTFLPRVYELDANGEINNIHVGYNYFMSNLSVTFGRDFSLEKKLPFGIYLKPQLALAIPNSGGGILYFATEAGITYRFKE